MQNHMIIGLFWKSAPLLKPLTMWYTWSPDTYVN